MLDEWLSSDARSPAPYADFEVLDVSEISEPSDAMIDHLGGLLRDARVDPSLFRALAEDLGWDEVGAWLEDAVPDGTTARRGQFGEVLAGAALEEFHGYVLPVQKLRYAVTAGQSQPSTDVLALLIDGESNEIEEVCFVEVKLRTGANTGIGTMGYRQLQEDYDKRLPDILRFVAARLHEREDELFRPFVAYLARRAEADSLDTFRLFLVQESGAWSETTLDNVSDEPVERDGLSVHVVRLDALKALTDNVFGAIGVTSVIDDVD